MSHLRRTLALAGLISLTAAVALPCLTVEAQISYETGFIEGTVTRTDGTPIDRATVFALSSDGNIVTHTGADGSYTMTVPVGDYVVTAHHVDSMGPENVSVAVGETAFAHFVETAGELRLRVLRDGEPANNAFIEVEEAAPAGCPDPSLCAWHHQDPNGDLWCECQVDERWFQCDPHRGCEYYDSIRFSMGTASDGTATALAPVADYELTIYTADEPAQWGEAVVATRTASVVDLGTTDLGDIEYVTGFIRGIATEDGAPTSRASIRAHASGSSWFNTRPREDGTYALRLPPDRYDFQVYDQYGRLVGELTVDVVAGEILVHDFAWTSPAPTTGVLTGGVTRDGEGIHYAELDLRELGPAGCPDPAECAWHHQDPNGDVWCECQQDERWFQCDPHRGCEWYDTHHAWANTDPAGRFQLELEAAGYAIEIHSGEEPGQWGRVTIASSQATVLAGETTDIGVTDYVTGGIAGSVAICEAPRENASVHARNLGGGGNIGTRTDAAGAYQMRVPVGDYEMSAYVLDLLGSESVVVTAGGLASFDAAGDTGRLTGTILRDASPAEGSEIEIEERGPESCAAADSCAWEHQDPNGDSWCECELAGRWFQCDPHRGCEWFDSYRSHAYTGQDGTFTRELRPADYLIRAYSGEIPGQHGRVFVGEVEATVLACQLSEIGAAGAVVEPGLDVLVTLDEGVTLDFSEVSSGGSVSYVATSTPQGGDPPAETIEFMGLYYDFVVEAEFVGDVEMCLPYDPGAVQGNPNSLAIYHYENGSWVRLQSEPHPTEDLICAITQSFSWYVVGEQLNQPPVADAGEAITVAADEDCVGDVPLDGSGSSDPDGGDDIVSYAWWLDGQPLAAGVAPSASFGPGEYEVELVVTDSVGESHSDTVTVTVVDETPPTLLLDASPSVLWPPTGEMTEIDVTAVAEDNCDPEPQVSLQEITSETADAGDMDASGELPAVRARRTGSERGGRSYSLHYRARDLYGNASEGAVEVVVPHDQRAL